MKCLTLILLETRMKIHKILYEAKISYKRNKEDLNQINAELYIINK